jgi:phosphoribosylaminoimidazolecarboxamide formyltransferase / IMP cyclohydrolase
VRLKYGCNPHQKYAAIEALDAGHPPINIVNGNPSLINLLDALNAWQLVREARDATGSASAASFKHVSPAGAAVAAPLTAELAKAYEVEGKELTPAALAYVRARGTDPKSSFGDFAALSEVVDLPTAEFLRGVISDGIIAPGFAPEALELLRSKKQGAFVVVEADESFVPPVRERRDVFGMVLTQERNNHLITESDLKNVLCGFLTRDAIRDLLLGLVVLKYTQSNSVAYVLGGQTIGIGAGQQSRVDCTKLAGAKADVWWLGMHPRVRNLRFKGDVKRQERINWKVRYIEGDLTQFEARALQDVLEVPAETLTAEERTEWLKRMSGVSLVSDGFIPFRDNIDHAGKHGVTFVAEPGGSSRSNEVRAACEEYGMTLVHTGLRFFHH